MIEKNRFEGNLDRVGPTIEGWVRDASAPLRRLTIRIIVDDTLWILTKASEYRQDLEDAGFDDGKYGFQIMLPNFLLDGRKHDISLEVIENLNFVFPGSVASLTLTGAPISIFVATEEHIPLLPKPILRIWENAASSAKNKFLFLAYSEDTFVGYAMAIQSDLAEDSQTAVIRFAVLSSWRSLGIGSIFINRLKQWAEENAVLRLDTFVNLPDGKNIASFLEHHGFILKTIVANAFCTHTGLHDRALLCWTSEPTPSSPQDPLHS